MLPTLLSLALFGIVAVAAAVVGLLFAVAWRRRRHPALLLVAVLWIGYGLWHAGARWLAPEHAGAGMPWTVLLLLLASAFGLRALRRRRQ